MNNIYDEILIALHSVWNRRWLALAVAWGICLIGWLVVALIPNSYESSARIFVQMQSILPGKIGITPSEQQKDIDRIQQTLTSTVNLEKVRSEEHTSELQSLMRISYAVYCLKKKKINEEKQDQ